MNNPLKEKSTVVLYYCYLCHKNLKVTPRRKCCKVYSFEAVYACGQCNRPFSTGFELRNRKVYNKLTVSNVRVYESASNVYFELVQNKHDPKANLRSDGSKCAEIDSTDTGGTLEETNRASNVYTSTDMRIEEMCAGEENGNCTDVDAVSEYSTFVEYIKTGGILDTGGTSEETNRVSNVYTSTDMRIDEMCAGEENGNCTDVDEVSDYSTFAEHIKKCGNTCKTSDDTLSTNGVKREHVGGEPGAMSEGSMFAEDEPGTELDETIRVYFKREHRESSGGMSEEDTLIEVEHAYTGNELDETICADVKMVHGGISSGMSDESDDNTLTEHENANTDKILEDVMCDDVEKSEYQDTFELAEGCIFSGAQDIESKTIGKTLEDEKREHTDKSGELVDRSMFDCVDREDQTPMGKISACSSSLSVSGTQKHPTTDKISKSPACAQGTTKEYHGIGSIFKEPTETCCYDSNCELFTTKAKTKRVKKRVKIKLQKSKKLAIGRTVKRSRVRLFTCKVCSLGFRSQTNLISHRSIHESKESCVCSVCNRSFSAIGYLKNHMRTHSEERSFPCDLCHNRFFYSSQLQTHIRYRHKMSVSKRTF